MFKATLIVVVLGTQGGLGNLVEPPVVRITPMQTIEECSYAKRAILDVEYGNWADKIVVKCIDENGIEY